MEKYYALDYCGLTGKTDVLWRIWKDLLLDNNKFILNNINLVKGIDFIQTCTEDSTPIEGPNNIVYPAYTYNVVITFNKPYDQKTNTFYNKPSCRYPLVNGYSDFDVDLYEMRSQYGKNLFDDYKITYVINTLELLDFKLDSDDIYDSNSFAHKMAAKEMTGDENAHLVSDCFCREFHNAYFRFKSGYHFNNEYISSVSFYNKALEIKRELP